MRKLKRQPCSSLRQNQQKLHFYVHKIRACVHWHFLISLWQFVIFHISKKFRAWYISQISGVQNKEFYFSHPEVFCKKGVLWNFAKFAGKHLYQSLFLNEVSGLWPATLCKKRLCLAQVLSCEFSETFKNTSLLRAPQVAASDTFWHFIIKFVFF